MKYCIESSTECSKLRRNMIEVEDLTLQTVYHKTESKVVYSKGNFVVKKKKHDSNCTKSNEIFNQIRYKKVEREKEMTSS